MVWMAVSYFFIIFYVFDRLVRVGQKKKKRGKGWTKGKLVPETETAGMYVCMYECMYICMYVKMYVCARIYIARIRVAVYQRIIGEVYVPAIPRLFPGVVLASS